MATKAIQVTDEAVQAALTAYRRFFKGFNSRTAAAWAGALHFPHVRVAPRGPVTVVDSMEQHMAAMSWGAVEATGWDHTTEVEPEIVQAGTNRVHIARGWTRFTKSNEPILSTRVTYIVTKIGEAWGIQSRFAVDPGTGAEAEEAGERVVRAYLADWNAQRHAEAASWLNYPAVQVHPGRIVTWQSPDDHQSWLRAQPWRAITMTSVRPVQSGENAVNLALALEDGGGPFEALVLVTRRDGHWGFQAESTMERTT